MNGAYLLKRLKKLFERVKSGEKETPYTPKCTELKWFTEFSIQTFSSLPFIMGD